MARKDTMNSLHEKIPTSDDAARISAALDAFLSAIGDLGTDYGALAAVSAPGDACMVGSWSPGDSRQMLELVTMIVSWIAARAEWDERDVRVFTNGVADAVIRHVNARNDRTHEG